MTQKELRKKRTTEGNCPVCGEWAYPYHYCYNCRVRKNINRVLRSFEKKGWVDVSIDSKTKKKSYKWNKNAPDKISKNYSPEYIAKMKLPRLKGKPMTEDYTAEIILSVLGENNMPLSIKEIKRGLQSLKTIGRIVPETEYLIKEYQLIAQKKSTLTKSQRQGVEMRIQFLLKQQVITEDQLLTIYSKQ